MLNVPKCHALDVPTGVGTRQSSRPPAARLPPTGGIGPEWPRWNWRLQVPTRGWMRLGIVRVATARLSDATGVITGPIMDSRLQSETAFNVNDRNPFDCRAIHATFHRRVDREQTVGTHSMRGIETEMGPASAGPISLSEKRCRTRAFNVEDFVLGLVQLFDQGDGKHFYVPIPSLCTSVVTRARLSFFRAPSIVESTARERSVVTSIGCKNRAIGTKHLSKSYIC